MGWGDLGVMGEPNRETPNVDMMARDGMLFTNFYTAAAICSPSRASMLTGRLPVRNGFYSDNYRGRNAYTPQNIVGGIRDSELLISEALKESGYSTKLIGKWHLGHRAKYHPLRHGFEEWFGAPNCHFRYNGKSSPNIPVYRDAEMVGRYYEDFEIDWMTKESNFTRLLTDEAVEYVERAAKKEAKPFFLYWAPDSTHAPNYAAKEFLGESRRDSRYGDAVQELDYSVGRIRRAVNSNPVTANNTLIIFTSDNGAAIVDRARGGSNGPLLCGKQTTFEGGFRTPTIAYWPGKIAPGSVFKSTATQMDFLPTFAELANYTLPDDRVYDGSSLVARMLSSDIDHQVQNAVYFYRGNLLYAIRFGPYKMHLWTWTGSKKELSKGIDFCPDMAIPNVTTTEQTKHEKLPILFHVERDPGEKFPIRQDSDEYLENVAKLKRIEAEHKNSFGEQGFSKPVLNWCNRAVENWSPPGCQKLNKCLPIPASQPVKCFWPH